MFLRHRLADPVLQAQGNTLSLRFASLTQWLAARRPRPRWRTPMVAHQQLRWARVSLLGRTPGWSPPAAAVGPWGGVDWTEAEGVEASRLRLVARLDDGDGVLDLAVHLAAIAPGAAVESAVLRVVRQGAVFDRALHLAAGGDHAASLRVPQPALWWPHTHGEPALYEAGLLVRLRHLAEPIAIPLGRIGFRSLEIDTAGGDFALRVNGVPVFCRGACWTPLDVASLRHTPEACHTALRQVRDAGMNMLRVAGTMVYEDDVFHDTCDALGILVWQDFMFANMDYPVDDPAFAASVRAEATQQLERWQGRPSLAVLCGNSEVAQQAAMWGAPRDAWSVPFFDRDLAELAAVHCPGVPWWPSSAHGGSFPHQNDAGTTAYYGVGAYLRPLDDARRSGLRFATECLAFANLPPPETMVRAGLQRQRPDWKTRTPRDLGAAWDFEDVRDHYLQALYRVDPVVLRSTDPNRYLALSRALAAEVMGATFAEWRRPASTCRGALVWFLRDLWAGAGWGLLDDQGRPKAAFHGLRRALAPLALFITDEGTNGLALHLLNEAPPAFAGTVEVGLFRDDGLCLRTAARAVGLPGRGAMTTPLADWFEEFIDLSRAYRFGPAEHALVVATLKDTHGACVTQAFHFPEGLPSQRERSIGLAAESQRLADGSVDVRLTTTRFAQSVHFDVPGFTPDDEYFHLAPGSARQLRLRPNADAARYAGSVGALNSHGVVTLELA
jgi:beta-mannosidase